MRTLRCLALVAFLVSISTADALAKDVCVANSPQPTNGSGRIIFQNVKPLKPGKVIPLTGVWTDGFGSHGPVDGTATMLSDGRVRFGVFVYRASISSYSANYTAALTGDADFNAIGGYDGDGDYVNGATYTWTNVACDTVALP